MKNLNQFLTDNRDTVISYYNDNVKGYYNATLKEFMTDLVANFRKITTCEEFKKFDLNGNLQEAKSTLGLMNENSFELAEDKKTNALKAKYAGTQYLALV